MFRNHRPRHVRTFAAVSAALLVAAIVLAASLALTACDGGKSLGTALRDVASGQLMAGRPPWGMFGKDETRNRRSPNVGPQTSNLKWKYAGTGTITNSSPTVGADGTIYIGEESSTPPNSLEFSRARLHAVNPDGTLKWTFQTRFKLLCAPAIGLDGRIHIVESRGIAFGGNDCWLYCLNPNGTVAWQQMVPTMAASLLVGPDGAIYMGCGQVRWIEEEQREDFWGEVYAFNSDGTLRWKANTAAPVNDSSPALGSDGSVYVATGHVGYYGPGPGLLYAFNSDGTERWTFTLDSAGGTPAVGDDGAIYCSCADSSETALSGLYSINSDGTLRWKFSTPNARGSLMAPALAADGIVYFSAGYSANHSGTIGLYGVSPSGNQLWLYAFEGGTSNSPAIGGDGTVYIAGRPSKYDGFGTVHAISPQGALKWKYALPGGGCFSSPAIGADGTVYVGNSGAVSKSGREYIGQGLYAFGTPSGGGGGGGKPKK